MHALGGRTVAVASFVLFAISGCDCLELAGPCVPDTDYQVDPETMYALDLGILPYYPTGYPLPPSGARERHLIADTIVFEGGRYRQRSTVRVDSAGNSRLEFLMAGPLDFSRIDGITLRLPRLAFMNGSAELIIQATDATAWLQLPNGTMLPYP